MAMLFQYVRKVLKINLGSTDKMKKFMGKNNFHYGVLSDRNLIEGAI